MTTSATLAPAHRAVPDSVRHGDDKERSMMRRTIVEVRPALTPVDRDPFLDGLACQENDPERSLWATHHPESDRVH
jgi:hypothetical protein